MKNANTKLRTKDDKENAKRDIKGVIHER